MKPLAFVLLVLAYALPLRADILANSHFTEGPSHWKGDGESLVGSGGMGDPTDAPAGVIIHLKPDKWTKIYQTFTASSHTLDYTISLKLSPDYSVIPLKGNDPSWFPGRPPGLTDVPGYPTVNFQEITGNATAVLFSHQTDGGCTYPLKLDLTKMDSQFFKGTFVVIYLNPGDVSIVVAFPPGKGSVTLTALSLETGSSE